MKAFNIAKHKIYLTNILIDFYKDSVLATMLGFKGGTAALLFYNLPRFSFDLDFDLMTVYSKESEELLNRITKILSLKYEIKDQSSKRNTIFWLVSYEKYSSNIKIEISTRDNPYNHYNSIPFYGVALQVMDIKDMIAHKLVAVLERSSIANRDLFDIHYFLSSQYAGDINYDIIKFRTGKDPKDFYISLLNFIEHVNASTILSGLGEILDEKQKIWVKSKLIKELKGLVQRQIDLF